MDEDRYEITTLLGKGRTGGVYIAQDNQLRRKIAIRRFLPILEGFEEAEWTAEFLEVAQALSAHKHTGLLDILEADIDEDGPYLSTEWIENGHRLSEWVTKQPLDEDAAIDLARQLLSAFGSAHELNIFHGALTAGSVWRIPKPDSQPHYVVMDMGLAKLASLALGHQPAYAKMADAALLAPEIFDEKPATECSDCYMLGQLIYLSILGGHPFALQDIAQVEQSHKKGSLPPLTNYRTDISKALIDWLEWLSQPDPCKRPQTTKEALSALPKPLDQRQVLLTPTQTVAGPKATIPINTGTPTLAKAAPFQPSPPKSKKKLTLAIGIPLIAIAVTAVAFSPSEDPVVESYYDESVSQTPESHVGSEEVDELSELRFEPQNPLYTVATGAGHPNKWSDVTNANNLDWVVFHAPLNKWDSLSRSKSTLIKRPTPIGKLKISQNPVGDLLFYNQNKKKFKPNLYGQCSKVGDGWRIEVKVPATAESLDLHLTTWNCDAELKLVDSEGYELTEPVNLLGDFENTSFGSRISVVAAPMAEPQIITLELTCVSEKSDKGHGISLNALLVK